ncbi:hypothetical protein [Halosimplex sp. TS25]|uniref:hypothetical protein n=1 Tax=Halosimplex rarum TaxID=3396619 RepID=UPI0039E895E8
MDRLSSCYFCGAALDATLEERPVVPSTLRPSTDSQKTVVLCVTCQRKLDAVLGTVLDAVEDGADDVAPGANAAYADRPTDERSDGAVPATGESPPSGDDLESTLGDDEDILTPIGEDDDATEDPAETADDDSADDSTDDRSKKPKYTKSRGAGFRREDDGPVDTGSLTGGAFSDEDDDDSSDSSSLTGDAFDDKSTDDESRTGGSSAGSGQSAGTADSGSASPADGGSGASGDGTTDDGASGQQRDVSMTRLENTKVMRLLENREFPVDRDEFVTVAANAYQVSRDDCDKVIDLAVEHGLLREENGQLYGSDS